jgi:hypothetical protein
VFPFAQESECIKILLYVVGLRIIHHVIKCSTPHAVLDSAVSAAMALSNTPYSTTAVNNLANSRLRSGDDQKEAPMQRTQEKSLGGVGGAQKRPKSSSTPVRSISLVNCILSCFYLSTVRSLFL